MLRFDCVFYYVQDLDRSVRFYSDVLGFRLIARDVVARYDVDGVRFELVPTSRGSALGEGNARLCLEAADLEETVEALRARGVAVGRTERRENGRLATFTDPDGNELVLWQYA